MSAEDSLPENLYVGRIRVKEGGFSEWSNPYRACGRVREGVFVYGCVSDVGLFLLQTSEPDWEWHYQDIYVLPVEGEE